MCELLDTYISYIHIVLIARRECRALFLSLPITNIIIICKIMYTYIDKLFAALTYLYVFTFVYN